MQPSTFNPLFYSTTITHTQSTQHSVNTITTCSLTLISLLSILYSIQVLLVSPLHRHSWPLSIAQHTFPLLSSGLTHRFFHIAHSNQYCFPLDCSIEILSFVPLLHTGQYFFVFPFILPNNVLSTWLSILLLHPKLNHSTHIKHWEWDSENFSILGTNS